MGSFGDKIFEKDSAALPLNAAKARADQLVL